jgi:hypothetical protein
MQWRKNHQSNIPDARLTVSVKCENGEPDSGIRQLNPLLQEMVRARSAALGDAAPEARPKDPKDPHFGRLTFSQA